MTHDNDIRIFLIYKNMSRLQQEQLQSHWDKYYSDVKDSNMSKLYFQLGKAISSKNLIELESIKAQIEVEKKQTLPEKPQYLDPSSFSYGKFLEYKRIEKTIGQLLDTVETSEGLSKKDIFNNMF